MPTLRMHLVGRIVILSLLCLIFADPALSDSDPKSSVVFLYQSAMSDLPFATGFLMDSRVATNSGVRKSTFLITNQHVIEKLRWLYVRFQSPDSLCSALKEIDLEQCRTTRSARPEVDLVAIEISDVPATCSEVDVSNILDRQEMNSLHLNEGAETYTVSWMTGRIHEHPVGAPLSLKTILRFGRISSLDDDSWCNQHDPKSFGQAYVVQMLSNPESGFSGCPLFLFNSSTGKITPKLIGVIKGTVVTESPVLYPQDEGTFGQVASEFVSIPSGLLTVEPAPNLAELMLVVRAHMSKSSHKEKAP